MKAPLITAALACILGNALYAAGYDTKALWILLASGLMVGFGKLSVLREPDCMSKTACHCLISYQVYQHAHCILSCRLMLWPDAVQQPGQLLLADWSTASEYTQALAIQ